MIHFNTYFIITKNCICTNLTPFFSELIAICFDNWVGLQQKIENKRQKQWGNGTSARNSYKSPWQPKKISNCFAKSRKKKINPQYKTEAQRPPKCAASKLRTALNALNDWWHINLQASEWANVSYGWFQIILCMYVSSIDYEVECVCVYVCVTAMYLWMLSNYCCTSYRQIMLWNLDKLNSSTKDLSNEPAHF